MGLTVLDDELVAIMMGSLAQARCRRLGTVSLQLISGSQAGRQRELSGESTEF